MFIEAYTSLLLSSMVVTNDSGSTHLNGAFTLDVKSVLNENLGGIIGGTHC